LNLLFVCSRNRLRSPTAEQLFLGYDGIETDSAGLSADADVVLSADQVEWADVIFVMEKRHRALLGGKRVICLDIADDYSFMQPELVAVLTRKVSPFL